MKRYFFKKEERLCSLKQIERLYSQGSSFAFYPFRIVSILPDESLSYPAQVVFTVPKRKFKRAVDRNYLKRLMREVYRKYKEDILYPHLIEKNLQLHLMIIYTGNEIITAENLEKKLNLALNRLLNKH
jgi:ribonuclease P protein component